MDISIIMSTKRSITNVRLNSFAYIIRISYFFDVTWISEACQ